MSDSIAWAKAKLDSLIEWSRVHLYKPIQIAEILFRLRTAWEIRVDPLDPTSYRTQSKHWRDDISIRLVWKKCTSSARFQDDLFNETAIPPKTLKILADFNASIGTEGVVEKYIYSKLLDRLSDVSSIRDYLLVGIENPEAFDLVEMISFFERTPWLKRSADKIYEIAVFWLFQSIVAALEIKMTLMAHCADSDILEDFSGFMETVVGLPAWTSGKTIDARIYRAGVANAADRWLDMWWNFWTVVQVKHLRLDENLAKDITESVSWDRIVIVCTDADKSLIESILSQLWWIWANRIQWIVTLSNLSDWYSVCMGKYPDALGKPILNILLNEFSLEFPGTDTISPFMTERRYDAIKMPLGWG